MMVNGVRLIAFLIIPSFMIKINVATSWDLAVTIGQEVNFFSKNGTLIQNITNQGATQLSSITYDYTRHMIFLGEFRSKNLSIFSNNLQSTKIEMNTLYINENGSYVMGMIYDSQTQSLFWTDIHRSAIFKMHIYKNLSSSEPELVLNLPDERPRGLSIDLCNRRLYWANSNSSNPSIISSNIDGTNRTVIVNENLYEPTAVTVDHSTAKLYWLDDCQGICYKIERSNLDGTNREEILRDKYHVPYQIAVDREKIYWTDWTDRAIWSINKNKMPKDIPEIWYSLDNLDRNAEPTGLLTRDNIENINCNLMKKFEKINLSSGKKNMVDQNATLLNIITKNSSTLNLLESCFNNGYYNKMNKLCQCKQGFYGLHCEQSLCHNYCLHGECKVMSNAQLHCECAPEYRGSRCETHVCSDYCFNGGECSIRQNKPFCTCKFSQGNRCEDISSITDICILFCANKLNGTNINFCGCTKNNSTNEEYNIYYYDSRTMKLIVIFSIVIGILTIIIVVLSIFVHKFRRRPRIKKRFLVSKTGITPLTSRPQLPPDGQCEIMIENCCNMNICETPCFEPKLRTPLSNNSKKEDRNTLLDNMHGNNSC